MNVRLDSAELLRSAHLFHVPGAVLEVRALETSGARYNGRPDHYPATLYGFFASAETAANVTSAVFGEADFPALYVTLNPVNPALRARAADHVKKAGKKGGSASDLDIVRRRWILVDCDPVRPAGISSTDEEKKAALLSLIHI